MTAYAELQVTTNFSFLRGASHPEELAAAAAELGLAAIAITDRNSLAGVVRAHQAARAVGIRLVVGARLDLTDGASLLVYPIDRASYGRLSRLLTLGKRRAEKGQCTISREDVAAHGTGQIFIVLPPEDSDLSADSSFAGELADWRRRFGNRVYLAAHVLYRGDDARRLAALAALARLTGAPLVATNDVHAHTPDRRPLQDVLVCIREGCTIKEAGFRLFANADRHLKPPEEMARLFSAYPDAVQRTTEVAARARFSLDELRYEYPDEAPGDGRTPQERLVDETWAGARARYGGVVPEKVESQLNHELSLIGELKYAPYFLTVHDIVRFARSKGILCQGRGSAANSAVCYCLGITGVDPSRLDLLFERFVSTERNEPPDIDVDFEHERREEVIQYIYGKYGRDRAGIAATVISYRARSAVREVGKALGLSLDVVSALSGAVWGWSEEGLKPDYVREAGLDPRDPNLALTLKLSKELIGFPRHLSQHVGGFVITRGPLEEVVPVGNAAMEDRTFIEWDKDDLDALGILKIDVLGLGMLTCLRKGFELIERHHGKRFSLATVPGDDSKVYDMLCRADSIGVFQVESRAQMSFLPRMKPRDFYDLVIEVAIVRPGPIQGDMVHPYLRRRNGEEKVSFPSKELRDVLGKTLGVPLFQEQAMKIAIVAAGFTPAEADSLRRAMATFRRTGTIHTFRTKMVEGMVERGYARDFALRCFRQIEGFGEYGFPESHAASFALLVYVSAWMKCHYPEVFAAALLNSQPMGFYAPAQIVRDAQDHGVEVRPVDANASLWDCTLEPAGESVDELSGELSGGMRPALRLGFRQVKGFAESDAERLAAGRSTHYETPHALWRRTGISVSSLECLARADAYRSMGLGRREALWAIKALGPAPLPLLSPDHGMTEPEIAEPAVALPDMPLGEQIMNDYASLRLTLRSHPLALLRDGLGAEGIVPCKRLATLRPDSMVTVAGLVLVRQRPGSAKGVIFATLEDEGGIANVIIWPDVFERYRRTVLASRLLAVTGRLQREGIVIHVVADRLFDLSDRLASLAEDDAPDIMDSSVVDGAVAHADEVLRRDPDPLETDQLGPPRCSEPMPNPRRVKRARLLPAPAPSPTGARVFVRPPLPTSPRATSTERR